MRFLIYFYVSAVIALCSDMGFADPVKISTEKDSNIVSWTAVGNPGFLRINGEGGHVEGVLQDDGKMASGVLYVQLDSFSTGMDLRNEHMKKKYLETEKYPKATLQIDQLVYLPGEFDWKGKLDLHGKIVEVKGKAVVSPAGTGKSVVATFQVLLSDFAIAVPSYLGVTMAEKVDVSVKFKTEK